MIPLLWHPCVLVARAEATWRGDNRIGGASWCFEGSGRALADATCMICRELMKHQVISLLPFDSVRKAAVTMRDRGVGFLPICDNEGRILGTLTDRDIALRVVADDVPLETSVIEVMTREVVGCRPEADIREAQRLMATRQKSRILCLDDGGHVVGVISLSDIAQYESPERVGETARRVSEREQER